MSTKTQKHSEKEAEAVMSVFWRGPKLMKQTFLEFGGVRILEFRVVLMKNRKRGIAIVNKRIWSGVRSVSINRRRFPVVVRSFMN